MDEPCLPAVSGKFRRLRRFFSRPFFLSAAPAGELPLLRPIFRFYAAAAAPACEISPLNGLLAQLFRVKDVIYGHMRQPDVQNLERTPLSVNINRYTDEELRIIFRRLNPYLLQRWMDHFIQKEEYEVCAVIRQVMADRRV